MNKTKFEFRMKSFEKVIKNVEKTNHDENSGKSVKNDENVKYGKMQL